MRFFKISLYLTLFFSFILASEISYFSSYKLKKFWQYEPVIGRWLSKGQGLIKIPKYMEKISFPYKKRPYFKEVPFAKGLTVVRLLGGWNYLEKKGELNGQKNADLVYLKNGKLKYRWDLLKKRLDPYINTGYKDLTLVLDNTPWDLPKKPKLAKPYGQVNPPYNFKKWEIFIQSMIKELIDMYGFNIVKNFRFRVGTECQSRNRFNGTYEDYLNLYLSTQRAIHSILPEAKIGPFNFAGRKMQLKKNNINMYKFMELIANKSTKIKPEVDFLPISTYVIIKKKYKKGIKKILDNRIRANEIYYETLFKVSHRVYPKEIQEFGILNYELNGISSDEPGARGAAWRLYLIQNMIENNISRLYHWSTFDKIAKNRYLLKGNGWIYSVMNFLAGGEAYVFPAVTKEDFHYKTVLIKKYKKVYLLISMFPDKINDVLKKDISINIPLELLGAEPKNVKWAYLNKYTSVIDVIHDDFLNKGMLNYVFLKDIHIVGRVNQMGGNVGRKYVLKHWNRYINIIKDSLTLKPFNGTIIKSKNIIKINMNLTLPAVSIIELSFEN